MISAINDVGSSAQDALDNIEGMDRGLKEMLSNTVNLVTGVGNLAIAIKGVGIAAKGIEKASAILMVISAAIQVVSGIFSIFKGGESSMERTLRQFKELNAEIENLKNRSKLTNWEGTIFGNDGFEKAANAIKVYNEALERFNKTSNDIINKGLEAFNKPMDLSEVIAEMNVQTQHATWFRAAEYEDLGKLVPSLFDENGDVDFEGLKKFMESDMFKKLSKSNRELITNLVNDWELYQDALDEMRGYLSDIFGDIGSELTNALVDAFENGTDASKAFADSLSNMLETFAADMVKTLFFADILKQAEEELIETMADTSLSEEEKFARYAATLNKATKEAAENQDDAVAFLEMLQRMAEENGFDIFNGDDNAQEATSKGFKAMSQDTGDELNGRFTDIQGKVTDIRTFVLDLVATGKLQQQETTNIRDIMIQLNGNVADIRAYTQVLPEMSETMTSMNKKLENL